MRRMPLLLKLSLRNVFRNRRHSLFALATIVIGAMGLLVFMGFNRGTMNKYRADTIRARWGHGQLYVRGSREKSPPHPPEKQIENAESVMERLRSLPGVIDLFPRVSINAIVVADGQTVAAQGEGIDGVAESRFFTRLNYVEGDDFKDRKFGIVLGRGLARGLGVNIGDEVRVIARDGNMTIRSSKTIITGIFHTGSQEFDSHAFRIPLTVAQALLGTDSVDTIAVALSGVDGWPAFASAAKTMVPELEPVPFDELDKVYYQHAVNWLDAQFAFIRGIILLMVFFGIFNAISMTVLERTAEIGTLRAYGEHRFDIAFCHVLEAAALGLLGGCLGLLGGWALSLGPLRDGIAMPPAPGLTRGLVISIELGLRDAVEVVTLCVLTSALGCLLPVWSTTRIPIAEALRRA